MINLKQDAITRLGRKEEYIIATDFDDTLVKAGKYPEFGNETEWFHTLKKVKAKYPNVKVILWTCREGEDLKSAIEFCKSKGLAFEAVNEDILSTLKWKKKGRKPFAHIYVDDRNMLVSDSEEFFADIYSGAFESKEK